MADKMKRNGVCVRNATVPFLARLYSLGWLFISLVRGRMHVAELLQATYLLARAEQQEVLRKWNTASWRIGGVLAGPMIFSLQQHGELDAVLRCVETSLSTPDGRNAHGGVLQQQLPLSIYWIGAMYEVLRIIRDRKAAESAEFFQLFKDFELLRMPLEKLEIAKDNKLKEPLTLHSLHTDGKPGEVFSYDRKDPNRYHIMPAGIAPDGGVTWQAIDTIDKTERWISRRNLSDRFLEMWGNEQAAGVSVATAAAEQPPT